MITKKPARLNPRTQPSQQRSKQRAQQILDVTALLLDRVGFDDLTTILITKELGISVGSLYHYFPSKHAILRTLAENWLSEWDHALTEITLIKVEQLSLEESVSAFTKALLAVYQQQRGVLPLVQAMYAVPELRDLDEQHDELVIKCMSALFLRMQIQQSKTELARLSSIFLEVSHTMLVMVISQNRQKAKRTLDDLNALIGFLLLRYQ